MSNSFTTFTRHIYFIRLFNIIAHRIVIYRSSSAFPSVLTNVSVLTRYQELGVSHIVARFVSVDVCLLQTRSIYMVV